MRYRLRYETDTEKVTKFGPMYGFLDALKRAYEEVTGKPFPKED